jgi:hypothetical protein
MTEMLLELQPILLLVCDIPQRSIPLLRLFLLHNLYSVKIPKYTPRYTTYFLRATQPPDFYFTLHQLTQHYVCSRFRWSLEANIASLIDPRYVVTGLEIACQLTGLVTAPNEKGQNILPHPRVHADAHDDVQQC